MGTESIRERENINMDDKACRLDTFEQFPFVQFDRSVEIVESILNVFYENGGESYTDVTELAMLYELARELHDIPQHGYTLDLGTHYGVSASVMASGLKKSDGEDYPVFTIDIYNHCPLDREGADEKNDRFRIARKSLSDLGLIHDICQIVCDDKIFLPFWNLPIRLVYVDARHDYDTVITHIDAVLRHLAIRGWMVFHDYVDAYWSDVIPAVNEFIDCQAPESIKIFATHRTVAIQKVGELRHRKKLGFFK